MSDSSSSLDLRIFLTNEEIITYHQSEHEHVAHILSNLENSHKFYAQPFLMIGESDRLFVLPTDRIARIDFISPDVTSLKYLSTANEVREISRSDFDSKYNASHYKDLRKKAADDEGTIQSGFVRLEVLGVGSIFWEVTQTSLKLRPLDAQTVITNLLTSQGLIAELIDGVGAMVINPATLMSASFLPGPPVRPPKAWILNK